MVIAVDFDGTVVTHEYPKVGDDIGAVAVLKLLTYAGHKLILYTMRSGKELEEAKKWFEDRHIRLYGVNENPAQKSWTTSPKVYANLYIDDTALGIPLKTDPNHERPYVDWEKAYIMLRDELGILSDEALNAPLRLTNE